MRIFSVIYTLFAKRLRLSNPWNYKVPVLISVTYLSMIVQNFKLPVAMQAFGWSLCTILGIAGFGYLSNDLGDRKADLKAGKSNLLVEISAVQITSLMVLFLALAILPWLVFFPLTLLTGSLLLFEFLLFVLYVLPPFRLKERGLAGVVTDALYAHVNPAILATVTFCGLAKANPIDHWQFLLALGLWQGGLGMRNILLHQLKDAQNDKVSGIRTFVTTHGTETITRWLNHYFVPFELLTWLFFLFAISPFSWIPLLTWPVYLVARFPKMQNPLQLREWLYSYLDDFYVPYLPLAILASLCIQDWRLSCIAVLHVLLFKSAFSNLRNRFFSIFFHSR